LVVVVDGAVVVDAITTTTPSPTLTTENLCRIASSTPRVVFSIVKSFSKARFRSNNSVT